jgi:hypothetical protein
MYLNWRLFFLAWVLPAARLVLFFFAMCSKLHLAKKMRPMASFLGDPRPRVSLLYLSPFYPIFVYHLFNQDDRHSLQWALASQSYSSFSVRIKLPTNSFDLAIYVRCPLIWSSKSERILFYAIFA